MRMCSFIVNVIQTAKHIELDSIRWFVQKAKILIDFCNFIVFFSE